MLHQISWSSYFEFVAILLAIYYAVFFFVFYRKKMSDRLALKFQAISSSEKEKRTEESEPIEYLMDEMNAFIHQAGYNRSPKEEILFGLQKLVTSERFESIDKSLWKDRIDDLIINECQSNCSIHLSEEDLRVLWL